VDTTSYTAAGTRRALAYDELKRRLLVGEFPLNLRLGEERLAAELDVSRTPVREALLRLEAEGLVERARDGGYQPVVPDVVAIRHLYEVRIALEVDAIHRPARFGLHHDAGALEELRDDWRSIAGDTAPEPSPEFVLIDEAFHIALAEASGNRVLADVLRQVNERIRLVRMHDFLTAERIEQTVQEHLAIAEALLADDTDAGERAFRAHVGRSMEVVEERAARALTRMATGGRR
jgi:DNA-binding GntR family transcriptional regulator